MEKIDKNKLILPIAVVLAGVILGSFYYANQIKNGNNSIMQQENKTPVQQNKNTQELANLYNQILPTLPTHDLYCIPSKKSFCTLEGCKDIEASIFVLLGKTAKEDGLFIARCDNKPCDVYDVNLLQSGAFMTFETKEPHGMLFRTSTLDQSFIEVVTLGTDSFVSNGYCYSK